MINEVFTFEWFFNFHKLYILLVDGLANELKERKGTSIYYCNNYIRVEINKSHSIVLIYVHLINILKKTEIQNFMVSDYRVYCSTSNGYFIKLQTNCRFANCQHRNATYTKKKIQKCKWSQNGTLWDTCKCGITDKWKNELLRKRKIILFTTKFTS